MKEAHRSVSPPSQLWQHPGHPEAGPLPYPVLSLSSPVLLHQSEGGEPPASFFPRADRKGKEIPTLLPNKAKADIWIQSQPHRSALSPPSAAPIHTSHAEQTFPGLSCSFRTKTIPPAYAFLSALPSPSVTNHQRTAQEPPGREFAC